jgi:methylated-DNA-[protein]-cysteine S-methyltransferase
MATNLDTTACWHTVVPTVLGELTLVRDVDALLGVYYPNHWHRPDPAAFGPRCDTAFDEVAAQLGEYLAGKRNEFDLPVRWDGDEFQQRVWSLIQRVPYGGTLTYGDLARDLGGGTTAQEVGAAVSRNPLCIVLPCHRIVGATGKLTGYAGGLARKRFLLDLEQRDQPPLWPSAFDSGSPDGCASGRAAPGR